MPDFSPFDGSVPSLVIFTALWPGLGRRRPRVSGGLEALRNLNQAWPSRVGSVLVEGVADHL